jgi:menaquinone-dependent protoporphyrinogen oxidase
MAVRNLIVFKSRHGTTAKAAAELAGLLGPNDTLVVDLARSTVPSLETVETVIVGGSIHIGKIQKHVTRFCKRHEDELLQKRLGLFICHMDKEHPQDEFDRAFPERLRRHATAQGLFGGEFRFDKMNFLERMVVKKVSGSSQSISEIDHEAIHRFALKMQPS